MKIERLLAITVMLLNRRSVTAKSLAEHFDVSVRTIYRDIETLNNSGIPIHSSQGYEGGFSVPENYKLSRQLLTFDDMMSLLTTLSGVNRTLQNNDIDKVIEKIRALVPQDKEPAYQQHADSFVIDISSWGMGPRLQQSISMVHQAVTESSLLWFDYTSADGRKNYRQVEPHTLLNKHFTWYLVAHCRMRNANRLFRLSRMRNLKLDTTHFIRRNINLSDFFSESESRPNVELILKFKPTIQVQVEEYFEASQIRYDPDGSLLVTVTFPEDDWILSFLLSFDHKVEVLSPTIWRKKHQEKIAEMQKIYSNLT
jgi:predicted DNA-binding transcriptional regulator YafY